MIELPGPLAGALHGLESDSLSRLEPAVRRLSERYRAGFPTDVLDRDDALAYVMYRMPATYAACAAALAATSVALPGWAPTSVVDFGAGPGTAAWAATRAFPSIRDVTLVERSEPMQAIGRALAQDEPVLRDADWVRDVAVDADLIVASYALGEAPSAEDALWDAARDVLVVVEPGTPRGFRTLIAARSMGISRGAHVAAPCPHDEACPMTQTSAWCHFSQRLPRGAAHRALKQASLPWEDEKYSYVALSRTPAERASARVVGHPRFRKHLARIPLCTREGLAERVVPKSDPTYRQARDVRWGDSFDETS